MERINLPKLTSEIMLHDAFANTSKTQVESALRFIFESIANHVAAGNEVAIPAFGKFAKFTSSTTERSKAKFTNAKALKDAVNA